MRNNTGFRDEALADKLRDYSHGTVCHQHPNPEADDRQAAPRGHGYRPRREEIDHQARDAAGSSDGAAPRRQHALQLGWHVVLHGVQEAGRSGELVAAVVRYAAGYGYERHPGDGGVLAHAAVDEVGHGNGDRDVAVAAVHDGVRQVHHRGDMALSWEWHEYDGALRELGSHDACAVGLFCCGGGPTA